MNNVELIGRLTKEPELKSFGKGKNAVDLCRFTLAVRDGLDAEGNERTQFISCAAWGKVTEILDKYVKKGDMLAVDGKIVNNNYEDKNGNKVYSMEVRVTGVYLLPNSRNDDSGSAKSRRG